MQNRAKREAVDGAWIVDGDIHVEHELFEVSPVEARPHREAPPSIVGLRVNS